MGNPVENEDKSSRPSCTAPPSLANYHQSVSSRHSQKDSVLDDGDVEMKPAPPLSHSCPPSSDYSSGFMSSIDNKAKGTVNLPSLAEAAPVNNSPQSKANYETNSALSGSNACAPQSEAVSSDGKALKTTPQKPQITAAPNYEDLNFMSGSQKPRAEACPRDSIMELISGSQQPLQGSCFPALSDDNKRPLEPRTQSQIEEETKANQTSDFKTETFDADGTRHATTYTEAVKHTADAKSEPSEETKTISVDHTGTISKEQNLPAIPHAEFSTIKTEHENDRVLKSEDNKEDVAAPKSNGSASSMHLFLMGDDHDGSESGTEEEQQAFMKKLEHFFKERSMEFKPPKFYGEGLNCLKLWRAVMRLGGYDKVTSCKLWRQVGESFKPPKTCTTVSWTFRVFYEKALLDYERHKSSGGELILPLTLSSEPTIVDNQAPGSGRVRRDAAARAMQGWHSRLLGNEVSDTSIKDTSSGSLQKREKHIKTLGLPKRKKPSYVEHDVKVACAKTSKLQLDVDVVDLGPPADWVKINVQRTKDCFEVYALVPGLLREEVRVQSDPAGRLVISGEPEHPDNPWGVGPFKKVVSLPSRIDPHQTSAVVTLHGQLFVRVPFGQ